MDEQQLPSDARAPPAARQCTPIPAAHLARVTSQWSDKLGEGATGEVFRGALEGAPIAVKRLRLPPDASPLVLAMLQKRFRAELGTLSSFAHPRIVRLLHFAEDADTPGHPFSLVFELLEEGSLADWLRGDRGEAAARGALAPLERLDAALGVAHGLAYLHGLDSGGEGRGSAAGEPTVHRDVKSANVGFTRIGGDLYAKLLECVGGGGQLQLPRAPAPALRPAPDFFCSLPHPHPISPLSPPPHLPHL